MNVNMHTMAAQEMSTNRAQVGADILQKTLQKNEEAKENNQVQERPETQRVTKSGNGGIDLYA